MDSNIKYLDINKTPLFYKDAFVVYMNLIKEKIRNEGLPADEIVHIMNNDLININRAPLIVLKRVSSMQPPNVNNINEKVIDVNGTKVVRGSSVQSLNMAVNNYGNTYLEAERLASLVQDAIIVTSVSKIRELSQGMIIGHEYLGWSGTNYTSSNSKLLANRIDIKITIALSYSVTLGS